MWHGCTKSSLPSFLQRAESVWERLIDIVRFSWVDEMINTRRTSLFNENYEGTDWTSPAISEVWSKTLLHFS